MAPIRSLTHVFAMVKWAKPHNQHHWFGQSATVCEEPSISCYIPIQRILGIRAHANLEVQFNDSKEILYASVLMQTLKCNLMTLRKYYMYLSRPLVLCKRNFWIWLHANMSNFASILLICELWMERAFVQLIVFQYIITIWINSTASLYACIWPTARYNVINIWVEARKVIIAILICCIGHMNDCLHPKKAF